MTIMYIEIYVKIKKVSDSHTIISREVSIKAHRGKRGINFMKNYEDEKQT